MSRFVPTWEQYKKELSRISGDIRGTIIIRLLSECGIAREELACALRVKRCAGTPNRSRAAGHDVPSLCSFVFI